MKKLVLGILAISTFGMMSFSAPKAKKEETYKVDAAKSSVTWLAKKVTGQHNGNVNISSGSLTMAGDAIKSGAFVIDMTSINVLDLQGEWKDKLVGHLKSDDFFSVAKNPTSKLEITKVSSESADKVIIEGNLIIKGISKPISFPAAISKKGNVLVAVSTFKIDRSKYDIRYGSKSFFESIGDKAIEDEFELQVNLVAIK